MDRARPPRSGRTRRPMLLALVFGIFLVLIGVTASALVAVASTHLSSTALKAIVSRDRDLVELFVEDHLRESDLSSAGPTDARRRVLEERMEKLASDDGITAIALRDRNGEIVASGGPDVEGLPMDGREPA